MSTISLPAVIGFIAWNLIVGATAEAFGINSVGVFLGSMATMATLLGLAWCYDKLMHND